MLYSCIMYGMRTTMDIPDQLYRRVRAKGAMDGLTLRAITITLYTDWLDGKNTIPAVNPSEEGADAADVESMPSWAGLCGDAITKNADGPHDMRSIRKSIAEAERLRTV